MANYPLVVYEYKVNGRRFTGHRISVGEIAGDFAAESTVNRYPQGAEVEVYYNPADPKQAVLERDPPPNFGKAIGGLLAFILACAIMLPIGVQELTERISAYIDRPENAATVTFLLGMALFVALIAYALNRQQAQVQIGSPPPVQSSRRRLKPDEGEIRIATEASGLSTSRVSPMHTKSVGAAIRLIDWPSAV